MTKVSKWYSLGKLKIFLWAELDLRQPRRHDTAVLLTKACSQVIKIRLYMGDMLPRMSTAVCALLNYQTPFIV